MKYGGSHYDDVSERWEVIEERMRAKIEGMTGFDRSSEFRLLNNAIGASSRKKSIIWLRKSSDSLLGQLNGRIACKKGCSHCCNIALTITKTEAEIIGKEIGRPVNQSAGYSYEASIEFMEKNAEEQYGVPCTFLKGGECSIYEFRPLACRLNINMDDDELLCKLVDDFSRAPKVPYFDPLIHKKAARAILGSSQVEDDIRNWFK